MKKLLAWPMFHLCYWTGHGAFLWLNSWEDRPEEGTLRRGLGNVLYRAYQGGMMNSMFWSDWGQLEQWRKPSERL